MLSTVAGDGTHYGPFNSIPATSASVFEPSYIYHDHMGNYYMNHHEGILMVTPSGTIYNIDGGTLPGYSPDGTSASSALMSGPYGITKDAAGKLYVAESGNNIIRKINTAGVISTFAGINDSGYSGDGGPATAAELYGPRGIAMDRYGNLYIADAGNDCVRKVNTAGIISTIAGTAVPGFSGDGGPATAAQLHGPCDVDVDTFGNIYIRPGKSPHS